MSRPLKKPLKKKAFPTAKVTSALRSLGSGVKVVVAQHPVMLGMGIMTGCTLAKIALDGLGADANSKSYSVQRAHSWLGALYADTHILSAALITIPMVTAVAGAVGGVAGALSGKGA